MAPAEDSRPYVTFGNSDPEISAMCAVASVMDELDVDARHRVATWLHARYAGGSTEAATVASPAWPEREPFAGRPYSDQTRAIICCLRDEFPEGATPALVADRTGVDRNIVKSTLHRLRKTSVVTTEARGFYRLVRPEVLDADLRRRAE